MTPGMQALAVYSAQVALVVAAATLAAWAGSCLACRWSGCGCGASRVCCASHCLSRPRSSRCHRRSNVTFGQVDAVVGAVRSPAIRLWLGPLVAGRRCSRAWRGGSLRLGLGFLRLRRLRRNSTPAVIWTTRPRSLRAAVAPRAELHWTERARAASNVRPAPPTRAPAPEPRHPVPRSTAGRAVPRARARRAARLAVDRRRGRGAGGDVVPPGRVVAAGPAAGEPRASGGRLAVRRTGARKPYMQALLWFAEAPAAPLPGHRVPAPPSPSESHATSRTGAAHEPHAPRRHCRRRAWPSWPAPVAPSSPRCRSPSRGAGLAQGPQAQLEIRLAESMPVRGCRGRHRGRHRPGDLRRDERARDRGRRRRSARVVDAAGGLLLRGRHVPRRGIAAACREPRPGTSASRWRSCWTAAWWPRRSSAARSGAARC